MKWSKWSTKQLYVFNRTCSMLKSLFIKRLQGERNMCIFVSHGHSKVVPKQKTTLVLVDGAKIIFVYMKKKIISWLWSSQRQEGRASVFILTSSAFFFSFRSYLTPVRDEEAESLRKARSRQARQTRRSTQVKNGNCHVQVKDEESQCAKKQDFFC